MLWMLLSPSWAAMPSPPDVRYAFDPPTPYAEVANAGTPLSASGCSLADGAVNLSFGQVLDCTTTGHDNRADYSPVLATGDQLSVAAWVRIEQASDCPGSTPRCTFVQQGNTDGDGLGFGMYFRDGVVRMEIHDAAFAQAHQESDAFPLGRWVHVLATVDGTQVAFYFDGQPAGSGDVGIFNAHEVGAPLRVGKTTNRDFDLVGGIDEVLLWGRPLAPSEVAALFAWYEDADGDGWAGDDDCDDADPGVGPQASELCNGVDDDCNGHVDDGLFTTLFYPDVDEDGFGDAQAAPRQGCAPLAHEVEDASDCNDSDPSINPAADDIPDNGIDEDCDGSDAISPAPTAHTGAPNDTASTADTGGPLSTADTSTPQVVPTSDTGVPSGDTQASATADTGTTPTGVVVTTADTGAEPTGASTPGPTGDTAVASTGHTGTAQPPSSRAALDSGCRCTTTKGERSALTPWLRR